MGPKLLFEFDVRSSWRTWIQISRNRPLLRNIVYGTFVFLALYAFIYATFPERALSIFPIYSEPSEKDVPAETWLARADQVKTAFQHAYNGYEQHAAPADELKPLSNTKINNFNGWGVTAFDSLDTMLLMGLEEEYNKAVKTVQRADFSRSQPPFVPFFETIIRYLGGLLSAYALKKDGILLERAEELVRQLDPIFDTPTGLPFYSVNPENGQHRGPDIGILAEIASLQLEYVYLAKLTGKAEYFNRSEAIMKTLSSANLKYTSGMLPVKWNITSGEIFNYHLSVGAQADSTHEYLLKLFLLTGKTDKRSLEMYIRATTYIITNLLYLSPTRNLLYVTDSNSATYNRDKAPSHVFEHLSCFLPGLLALGVHTLPLDKLEEIGIDFESLGSEALYGEGGRAYTQLKRYNLKDLHLWAAEGLGHTCWVTYADQPTGLGPDEMQMETLIGKKAWSQEGGKWSERQASYLWIDAVGKWKENGGRGIVPGLADPVPVIYSEKERLRGSGRGRDYMIRKTGYLLRPETVESLYLLWKVTGDVKWRTRGWRIFEAIERETRTSSGYAALSSVMTTPAAKADSMPSYFLAETLKYLYLMFLDNDPISLDAWVFNTEAHPFPVFNWTSVEKTRFNLVV